MSERVPTGVVTCGALVPAYTTSRELFSDAARRALATGQLPRL